MPLERQPDDGNAAVRLVASVVVPSYQAADTIEDCLRSILMQQTNFPFEILVVDSSTDATPKLIRQRFPDVRLEHVGERLLPGQARNRGAALAQADILVFIDADCIAADGWLAQHIREHRNGAVAVGGSIDNAHPWSLISIAEYFLEFREYSKWARRRLTRMSPTCNFSVRLEQFQCAGGFPDLRAAEDAVFGQRLADLGEAVIFVPEALIRHRNRTTWKPFLRNQAVLGAGFIESRRTAKLPGAFLLASKWYLPLAAVARLGRSVLIILRERPPGNVINLLGFLVSLPIQVVGLSAWILGVWQAWPSKHREML